jgi:hydroxyethylthiazole kinase-like uncharacterized protein yjeF
MKILSPEQIKRVETQTITIQDIDLINLMERAASAVLNWLKARLDVSQNSFTIVCGIGNNGGDGLALGRLLWEEKANVKIYLQKNNTYSLDNLSNQKRLRDLKIPIEYFDESTQLEFIPNSILIDAIFGYGLSRPIGDDWRNIIHQINAAPNTVISIDVPSGLFCHQINSSENPIVESEVTLTFQTPKLSLFLPENQKYVKEFEILDISLDWESILKEDSKLGYFSLNYVPQFYFKRPKFSHKYNYGNVLIIGGSYGKIGATLLAAKAVLKSGAGLVTAYLPKCGYTIFQTAFPEAMILTDFSEDKITKFPKVDRFDTIIIGPGLGTDEKTYLAFEEFLAENDLSQKKIIIDADGLNLLGKHPELINKLPKETILTPHDKELERLMGKWETSVEKIEKLQKFVQEKNLIVVSKGFFTQTFLSNGEAHFNSSGNPGMATAGSGDVLAGIIGGLYAKGYPSFQAAIFGVFLHGYSGDLAAQQIGEESIIASDLVNYLPMAFKSLFG